MPGKKQGTVELFMETAIAPAPAETGKIATPAKEKDTRGKQDKIALKRECEFHA